MAPQKPTPSCRIFTLGHSNHSPEHLIELLARHGIDLVVDVRSSPYARYATHFNKEPLQEYLRGHGIEYLFLGDVLGGRPAGAQFYDGRGHVLYDRLARSPAFCAGVRRLLDAARDSCLVLLCGEEDPGECHRRLLLGRVLMERGVEIFHIRGDGRLQNENELDEELRFSKTKGQMTLFDIEEPQQWKSTQSVLPKSRPETSSRRCEGPESNV